MRALGPVGPTYNPDVEPEKWQRYTSYYRSLLRELAEKYAPDLFWIDINQQWDLDIDKVLPELRAANPDVVMTLRDNWMDNQFIFSDYIETDDQSDSVAGEIADSYQAALGSTFEVPTVLATSGQWSYDQHTEYKSASIVLRTMNAVNAKGGNLLLNVGPGPTGLWDPKAVSVLTQMASWMDVNSEAVHGCVPLFPHQALAKVHQQCTDSAHGYQPGSDRDAQTNRSSTSYFYSRDEMVVTIMQQRANTSQSSTTMPVFVRLSFGPYDAADAKSNVIQSLRGLEELDPNCKNGRTIMRLPFVKSTLLHKGLEVSDVVLLGDPNPADLQWNGSAQGLTVSVDASTRLFGARLFGPSSLPAVFKISFRATNAS